MRFRQTFGRLTALAVLAGLVACSPPAAAPATESPPPVVASLQPVKPSGKLTPRLQMLASMPALRNAPAAERARALSLPEQGPGSLVLDAHGRVLVSIRASDVSTTTQQTVQHFGAQIVSVSDRYQELSAFVPMDALSSIADLPIVFNVQEALAPGLGDAPAGGAVPPPKPSAYP